MKPADKKLAFIRLRAEGKSYRAIEAEIGVSRTTCSKWEKDLSQEIARLKAENLEALYIEYGMLREERIRRIGDALRRIDSALEKADLTQLSPDKLLTLKLKYQAALKEEYTSTASTELTGEAGDVLEAIQTLYRRFVSGEATAEQVKTETALIDTIVPKYRRAHPLSDAFRL